LLNIIVILKEHPDAINHTCVNSKKPSVFQTAFYTSIKV
jgi:hypothetical protein